jgi:hypothetical protein
MGTKRGLKHLHLLHGYDATTIHAKKTPAGPESKVTTRMHGHHHDPTTRNDTTVLD